MIVAALDARNKNFFAGAYRGKEAVIADGHYHLSELLEQVGALPDQKVIFVGSDFRKYQEEIAAGWLTRTCAWLKGKRTFCTPVQLAAWR